MSLNATRATNTVVALSASSASDIAAVQRCITVPAVSAAFNVANTGGSNGHHGDLNGTGATSHVTVASVCPPWSRSRASSEPAPAPSP